MKRIINKIFTGTLAFLILINAMYLSNPLDKAYANSLVVDNNKYSTSDQHIANLSLSDTAKAASIQSSKQNESISKNMIMSLTADEADINIQSTTGASINLIENGDFELDPALNGKWEAYWETESGEADFYWDNEICHGTSGSSISIIGTNVFAEMINGVDIQPGNEYTFTAWGKADNVIAGETKLGSFIYICQYDGDGNTIIGTDHLFYDDGTFDWSKASYSFTAQNNAASVVIMLGLNGSGAVWYDDVSLTEDVPVAGLSLNNSLLTMKVGDTYQLAATVLPENATNKDCIWSIESGNDVVSINSSGLLEAFKPGTAVVRVTSDLNSTKYAECTVTVVDSSSIILPENAVVTDSVMHPTQPIVYITDKTNRKLYSINYETQQISEMTFSDPPESIAFSENELYIALLKGEHSPYWWEEDQKGTIAVVDTNSFTLKEQFDINLDPSEIVAGRDGYLYIISGSGQWTYINSYSKLTKQLKGSASIRQHSSAELHPNYDRIYTIQYDGSVVINTFDVLMGAIQTGVGKNGVSSSLYGNFRLSPDGKYMFNSSGAILNCDIDKSKDMKEAFKLHNSFTDISFDLANNRFFTAVSGKAVYSYDYNTFKGISTYYSSGNIKTLCYRDATLLALSKLDNNQFIIEKIDPSNDGGNFPVPEVTTIQLQKNGDKLDLNYSINDSVIDPSGSVLYITDSANNKIASINYETSEVKEVSTSYSPGSIAYYNNELYIGYGDQREIEIYDAQTLSLKDVIYTMADFFDLTIGKDGFIYTSSYSDSRSYSRTSRQEVSSIYFYYRGYLEAHPTLDSLYMTSIGISPGDVYVLNYSDGSLISQYDSPYHGDYPIGGKAKISPDGKYLFTGNGEVFYCSQNKSVSWYSSNDNRNTNLTHAFSLNSGTFNDVAFDLPNNLFYSGNSNGITSYDYSNFQPVGYVATTGEIVALYNMSDRLLCLEKKDGTYFLVTIKKNAFGDVLSEVNTPNYSDIPPFTIQNAANAIGILTGTTTKTFQGSTASAWYRFEPDTSGVYKIACPQAWDMTVYDSKGFDIAFRSNSGEIQTKLLANRVYYIRIGNYYSTGSYTIDLSYSSSITNASINKISTTIEVGNTEQLLATKENVVWSIESGSNNASVSSNGLVTGLKSGTAVVRATNVADATDYAECIITVSAPRVPVERVELNKTTSTIETGNTEELVATVYPENATNKTIIWTIESGSDVATVAASGLVTALKPGTAVVRATSGDDATKYAECSITFNAPVIPVESIALNKSSTTVKVGSTEQLIVNILPDNATNKNVIWSVQTPGDVVSVSTSGLITALKPGTAVVRATSADDAAKFRECYVTSATDDNQPIIPVESIQLNKTSLTIEEGSREQLAATVLPANASDKKVVWLNENNDVAVVSVTGELLALKPGIVVIRAASMADPSKFAECTVTVIERPKIKAPELTGFTWAQGNSFGTTKATAVPMGTLKYVVGVAGAQVRPYMGDAPNAYTNTLAANTDIAVAAGQHIFIVQIDFLGNIVGWADIAVDPAKINSTPDNPAPYNPTPYNPPVGGGGNTELPADTLQTPKDGILTIIPVASGNTASAKIDEEDYKALLESSQKTNGVRNVTINIDNTSESSFNIGLPVNAVANSDSDVITSINTAIARIEAPSNMFDRGWAKGAENIEINIALADKADLPDDVANIIGDSPILDISATIDGKSRTWSNPNAPVKIAIPYTLKKGESASNITVFYIDGNGKLQNMQGIYNAKTKMVEFTTTHFSMYLAKENKILFTDLVGFEEYAKVIENMASKGIIEGVGFNKYSPGEILTRAEFATLLVKMLKLDVSDKMNMFKDVKSTDWYAPYVNAAYKAGLISGIGDSKFAPNEIITNQDAAIILVKALKYKGIETTSKSLNNVTDIKEISNYALSAVNFAVSEGIITLDADSKFNAKSTVNRAVAAKYIYNVFYFQK